MSVGQQSAVEGPAGAVRRLIVGQRRRRRADGARVRRTCACDHPPPKSCQDISSCYTPRDRWCSWRFVRPEVASRRARRVRHVFAVCGFKRDARKGSVSVLSYVRWHWSLFNVLVRVMGIWFGGAGVVALASGVFYVLNPLKTVNRSEGPVGAVIACFVLGVLLALFSVVLLRVRPYRPDLHHATSNVASRDGPGTLTTSTRSWWTGLPKA